nr:MAG TPA: hypothetical protein [Caudoviricetes sp.]
MNINCMIHYKCVRVATVGAFLWCIWRIMVKIDRRTP